MRAHPLELGLGQRPRLVPDRVRNPEPAEVVDACRPTQLGCVGVRQARARRGLGDELSDGVDVTHDVRRLQLGELADRLQREVELLARDLPRQRRLGCDHRVPARRLIELAQHHRRLLAERVDQIRIELRATALPGDHDRRLDAAGAPEHLDHVREVDQPRADGDVLALDPVCAPAIPPLVRLSKALADVIAEAETLHELVGRTVVVLCERLHRAQPVPHERQPNPGARSASGRSGPPTCLSMNEMAGPTLPMS